MMKRVCLIRHGFYPADMLVRREAAALRDYGFEVELLCLRYRGQPAKETVDGISVRRLPLGRRKGSFLRYLYNYTAFFVYVAVILTLRHWHRPYAFIQVNTMPDFLVFATLIPRLFGARIMLQMYEPTPELWAARKGLLDEKALDRSSVRHRLTFRTLRRVAQAAIRYAHSVFTVTQQLRDNCVAHGATPDKMTVILNVPDHQFFEEEVEFSEHLFSGKTENRDSFILISHGAIEERYGFTTMLRALDLLKKDIPGLQLRIAGLGSYLNQFLAKVEAMELQDRVHYLGHVPFKDLVSELQRAHAGIVALEASMYSHLIHTGKMFDFIALKKPVIVSRLRAVEAYFNEDSLRYFNSGDPEDLAGAILEIFRQPEKRQAFVRNASLAYEQYRWEKQREFYWSAYAEWDRRLK